jgi:hypothetical protein
MEKKEIKNKKQTPKTETKAPKKESKVDFSKLGDKVDIIATGDKNMKKGQEYNVTKEMAIILINKGAAKLK